MSWIHHSGQTVITGILMGLFFYQFFMEIPLVKGWKQKVGLCGLELVVFGLSQFTGWSVLGLLLMLVIAVIYLYFYHDDVFSRVCLRLLPTGSVVLLGHLFVQSQGLLNETMVFLATLLILFYELSGHRGYLRMGNALMVTVVFLTLMCANGLLVLQGAAWGLDMTLVKGFMVAIGLLGMLLFALLEMTLVSYSRGYVEHSKALREELIGQQYEDIQAIYLNVRGWRHDYHNHVQVLRATLEQGQIEAATAYLNEIDQSLRRVDTYVKSGNVMADAIINSKLTLAEQKGIQVVCEAFLPEKLFLSDVDLCTLLGNLLDNALESCEGLPKDQRFIRLYMAQKKEQLYLSIQNASNEEPVPSKQFLKTKKLGNHGLGIQRVEAVVKKREGFVSFNQQPGVFATELSIPVQ